MINPYNYYEQVTVNLLLGNLQTLSVTNDTLNLWTTTNNNLTTQWTTGMPDPNSDVWKDYENILENKGIDGTSSSSSNADMAAYIGKFLQSGYLTHFSQMFMTDLMTLLSYNGTPATPGGPNLTIWDATNGPIQMNMLNQFNSLVSSTGQNDEQLGQQETKTENSEQQQLAGEQQPLSDGFNAVAEAAANAASILNQSF